MKVLRGGHVLGRGTVVDCEVSSCSTEQWSDGGWSVKMKGWTCWREDE